MISANAFHQGDGFSRLEHPHKKKKRKKEKRKKKACKCPGVVAWRSELKSAAKPLGPPHKGPGHHVGELDRCIITAEGSSYHAEHLVPHSLVDRQPMELTQGRRDVIAHAKTRDDSSSLFSAPCKSCSAAGDLPMSNPLQ